jgi:hypothetical protein
VPHGPCLAPVAVTKQLPATQNVKGLLAQSPWLL